MPSMKAGEKAMTDQPREPANRLERRKQRTRAALIKAAQGFIAAGKFNVAVLEITQAADVGMGSFYNHFDSKEQLFQAALNEIFDAFGARLDRLPSVDDPAETFARAFRLTIRWVRRRQDEAGVLLNVGLGQLFSDRGLVPRALRDITAANQIGRFQVANHELAVTLTVGTHLALTQLLRDQPERDADQAADQLAEDLLRLFGLSAEEAREICRRPLPELDDLTDGAPDQRTETVAAMPADDNSLAMSMQ
jgi:AcrR family transcriptional regulator